jgi:carbamate kinase
MQQTALVAIGGNSLITDKDQPDVPHQWDAVRETCRHLADLVEAGWRLVITHGNGPQVGYILRRNELAAHALHTTPLDLIVADTQGAIGYMLQQALGNELLCRGVTNRPVVTVVSQVLVDANDPAFQAPNKPIGGFLSEAEARQFEAEGWQVVEDAGRGWRRVVASPEPLAVIEEDAIRLLLDAGCIVIAAGGGGIPVVQNPRGELRELKGTYAVIDKDRASSLLARRLGAELFVISTAVPKVCINYKKPNHQELDRLTPDQADSYMQAGHFAAGSMRPKIEAVVSFVRETGHHALITDPANIGRALGRQSGTWIEPD